jgi:hypothetical protein
MITATVELKTKGILPIAEKEIFAAGYQHIQQKQTILKRRSIFYY